MTEQRERAEAMAREVTAREPFWLLPGHEPECEDDLADMILAAKAEALEEAAGRMIEIASHVSGDSLGWDECCEAAAEDIRALAAQEREG